MDETTSWGKILRGFEVSIVVSAGVLLALSVAIAVVVLYVLFVNGLRTNMATIMGSVDGLLTALQNVFGGVLLVLLGLELIESLKVYFSDGYIRTEAILIVAMIAVARHIIQIDYHDTSGLDLVGTATIIFALAASYFLVQKGRRESSPPDR